MENTTTDQEIKDGAQAPAETSATTDTTVQDTAPADTAETSQEDTQADAEQDWKAHARTWERRAKADHKQLEALTEAINGKDTTIEELRTQVAALEAQAHRAKLIAAAASEYGVPADLIHGDTEDEIKQVAQRLADWRGATATPAVPALAVFSRLVRRLCLLTSRSRRRRALAISSCRRVSRRSSSRA